MKTDGGYDRKNVTGTGFTWPKDDFDEKAFLGKLDQAIIQLQSLLNKQSEALTESTSTNSQSLDTTNGESITTPDQPIEL